MNYDEALMWITRSLVLAGIVGMVKHIMNDKIHVDISTFTKKEVCEERHKGLQNELTSIKASQLRMETKLDRLLERNPNDN